jgi:hypothetical protein
MKSDLIDTKQIDLHFEKANMAAEQAEKNAKITVSMAITAGTELNAAKSSIPHGEWLKYLGKNWNYSQQTASRYMAIASKLLTMSNLNDAETVNDALRMIAAEKAAKEPVTAPRSERKSGQVEVVEPETEPDDDPTPDPPTNRKTAKGSEKVKEADKPKTAAITPELIDEPEEVLPEERTLSDWSETQILDFLVATADEPKPRAKRLRKVADKLDPPTKFVKPDLEEVSAYFAELKAVDPDSFFDFYESKGWLVGKVSMKDWRASARKWVRENNQNGKVNGNGSTHQRNGKRGYTADEVFS